MNTEERVPAQHFDVPVVEVEGIMQIYGRRVDGRLVIGSVCYRGVDGRLVIGGICDCEVGQSGDADGRRLSDGSDGRCRNCVRLWNGDRFERRVLRELRFEISVRKPQGCGDGSCNRVFLVFASRVRVPGRECRREREAFPPTLP